MKDVFLATDELSKLKIQTIVPTAEQSEQVTPLATQKAACSPNSVGLASPTAKASQRWEGGRWLVDHHGGVRKDYFVLVVVVVVGPAQGSEHLLRGGDRRW